MHYFGSCPEIRSSSRFLREIWISYFARRILEGIFVGGIVNIRNECLFFSVHGKWIAVRNKQIAREPLCGSRDLFVPHCIHFPWTEKKRHSFLNWSVASPQLVGDLSDETILWRNPCAIKYVTMAQQALYWNRNSHTSYLIADFIKYNQNKNNLKTKYGLFEFSFKDSLAPILSKLVVNWRGPVCH